MDGQQRIGEVLGRMGKLTPHDIEDILAEQRATRQRFGHIAVSMGFCEPEHIWSAWCAQLGDDADRARGPVAIDLDEIGIDAQAADCLPRDLALGLHAMPVRVWEGQLVVAVADPSRASGVADLARRVGMQVRCVLAPEAQVEQALAEYYPSFQRAG